MCVCVYLPRMESSAAVKRPASISSFTSPALRKPLRRSTPVCVHVCVCVCLCVERERGVWVLTLRDRPIEVEGEEGATFA